MLWNYKKSQNVGVGRYWAKQVSNICLLRQSQTKYLEENGVIQSNWTRKEWFGILIFVFFNCYLQSLSF